MRRGWGGFLGKTVAVMKSGFSLLLSCFTSSKSFKLYRHLVLYSVKYSFLRYYCGLRLLTRGLRYYASAKLLKVLALFSSVLGVSGTIGGCSGSSKRWVTWKRFFLISSSCWTLHSFLESLWLIFCIFPVWIFSILFCIFNFFS